MYDIDLNNNESIECIDERAILKVNGIEEVVVAVVTNLRMIILKDMNKDIEYKVRLGATKNVSYFPKYEPILTIDKNKVVELKLVENDFFKYVLADTNYFIMKSNIILNAIKERIN